MTVESLPGFVGWFTEDEVASQQRGFSIGCWGLRRVAVFDHELTGGELDRALDLLGALPTEYDPIAEMRIEVFSYWKVVVDVRGLHLASSETQEPAFRLLDPEGTMGMVGLANMAVSRVRKAFASEDAARRFAGEVTSLGLSCEVETEEKFLSAPGILIEDETILEREVARRLANGEELVAAHPEERVVRLLCALFGGFDV